MPTRCIQVLTLLCLAVALAGCNHDVGPHGEFDPRQVTSKEAGVPGKTLMILLDDELVFRGADGSVWMAPNGTLTDGASVPSIFLPITNGRFDQRFFKAAIVHDAYCQKENELVCPDQYRSRPWRDVHKMFYHACRACGTPPKLALAMFAAVWLRGPRWDDPQHALETVSEELLQVGIDGCAAFVEEQNPSLDELVSWIETTEPVLRTVSGIGSEFGRALDQDGPMVVDEARQQADVALAEALADLPDETIRQNLQGYHYSFRAEQLTRTERTEEASQELDRAEAAFRSVTSVRPQDPSAGNGLIRIDILRSEPGLEEGEVRSVLEAEPENPVARRNLELIESLRGERRHP